MKKILLLLLLSSCTVAPEGSDKFLANLKGTYEGLDPSGESILFTLIETPKFKFQGVVYQLTKVVSEYQGVFKLDDSQYIGLAIIQGTPTTLLTFSAVRGNPTEIDWNDPFPATLGIKIN